MSNFLHISTVFFTAHFNMVEMCEMAFVVIVANIIIIIILVVVVVVVVMVVV